MNNETCKAIVQRDRRVVAPTAHLSYYPLVVERADGAYLYDADGNRFLDFLASASAMNLGGTHPAIVKVMEEQIHKCVKYTAAYSYNLPLVEYAERLTSVYPGGISAKICFGNCGSDANDAAIKFARAYTGRSKIVTFRNAYHGSSFGAMSLSCVTTRMRSKMGPMLPDIYHFPFFDTQYDDETCERECLAEIKSAFQTYLPVEEVAAVIIEPIQGDGGLIPAHPIFMKKLYALCREHGILFISEEVQQAFFRTGTWFGIEHYDIVPDGIILGKSAGGGIPLGAFMARSEIMDALPAPAHLFTFSGNHLACAAGVAQFDVMADPVFQAQQAVLSKKLADCFADLKRIFPETVERMQGIGLSQGIVLNLDDTAVKKIVYRSYELGLIMISLAGNILRIQPPLVITEQQLDEGFAIIKQTIRDYSDGAIPDSVLEENTGW